MSRAVIRRPAGKPFPVPGQWWRFDGKQTGRIARVLSGGAGDLGIVEWDGYDVPSAHVATMMRFDAWQPAAPPVALEAPCTCVALEGGMVLSDGCARHRGDNARDAAGVAPALEARP